LAHRSYPGPLHDQISKDAGIKRDLFLVDEKTLNKALMQTIDLEMGKLSVRYSVKLRKTSYRILWRRRHPANGRRNDNTSMD
jgi:hypothetical protein